MPFKIFGFIVAATTAEAVLIPDLKKKMTEIQEWFNNVTVEVDTASTDIKKTKEKLDEEADKIGEVKSQTEVTNGIVIVDYCDDVKEDVLEAVDSLVSKCKEYMARHISNK